MDEIQYDEMIVQRHDFEAMLQLLGLSYNDDFGDHITIKSDKVTCIIPYVAARRSPKKKN